MPPEHCAAGPLCLRNIMPPEHYAPGTLCPWNTMPLPPGAAQTYAQHFRNVQASASPGVQLAAEVRNSAAVLPLP
eukprot:CAMPEP_0174379496 /NCGR_PEP_ID=MMETSP0811_2-20130205/122753_1 /TAXON_ID=73025 ORGANISM="Eutreptiella gymnastica-like, Strain CCMP1594" /NCGR_SAMPLE_ID=MMETSP0811_2 /ASSEMBLY_ACC=CAM_ASM_000667 /LENGTH=74 /DNA_ID=CAMNT_0015532061 /DNA_START=1004 /DNA_END=1229 /DNA_ORIENTATION=+